MPGPGNFLLRSSIASSTLSLAPTVYYRPSLPRCVLWAYLPGPGLLVSFFAWISSTNSFFMLLRPVPMENLAFYCRLSLPNVFPKA